MHEMEISLRNLPNFHTPPTTPFAGLVVNINVVTRMHRDAKDKLLCCVTALGDYEGAELCFYEQGLVIPLRSGDLVVGDGPATLQPMAMRLKALNALNAAGGF